MSLIEAVPYLLNVNGEKLRNELYGLSFNIKHVGNLEGSMPLFNIDFHENEEEYAARLRRWRFADRAVLFDGWIVKDMQHWHVIYSKDYTISILIEFNTYSITLKNKEYKFPILPDTIDNFINDCRRISLKLFWKQEIIDKFGIVS